MYLGKLQYFTNLNLAAIKGDDSPEIDHDSQGSGEQWGRYNLPRYDEYEMKWQTWYELI